MELTDTSLLVLLGVLALVVFVLVVIGWPRWSNRIARAVTRGVQVLLLNVIVVALCGAALNDQYVFYSSWADLLGSRSASVQVHHGGTTREVVTAKVPGLGLTRLPVTPATLPPLPHPGARLQTYGVVDQRSNAQGQVLVYLPVGYDPRSAHAYPVIIGLHGFPSGPRGFVRLNFLSNIDALTAAHKMAPTIVVVPRIDTPAGLDTECVNGGPGEPQTDTWLARDIPDWTAKHFHVQRVRTSWAAVGYSYGAWCAASIAMRHPDVFGAAIAMQGYFRPDFSAHYDPLTSATLGSYDLINLAHTAPPALAMWVLTSREDNLSYPTTSMFLSVARPPLDVTATVLARGGHRDSVWEPFVGGAIAWLSQTMPGFHG
jgi:S-formylglutathione hydrolase FrmB